ncbi:MAG TPA: nucleoside hydrolase [Acidimicrobiales bacterium]|nr:nucleoside hydrolase [Acidimicrobiales bacterium]
MAHRLVLDCDTGTDDAVAIMLAALHPDLDLVGVTTVNGNVPVTNCTENSLRVLDHISRSEVPVYEGASEPIARPDFPLPRAQRGTSKVHGEYLDIPPARSKKQQETAANYLVREFAKAAASGEQLTLVAVGPLTNVALALKLDPNFKRNVSKLVIMGGGHEVPNVTPSAEFNIWGDPEGARVVLTSGIDEIVLVPLDATHKALVSLDDCEELRGLGTPAGEATATFVERRIHAYDESQPMGRLGAAPVHDALCIAFLVDPSVIPIDKYYVDVETEGPLTVGRTVVDTHRRSGKEPNVWVALDADEKKFVRMLIETFGSPRAA